MKKIVLIVYFIIQGPLLANAFMLHDIDFEPPAYTNGQIIGSTGLISDSINGFITQALLIQNGGAISYYAPESYTSGVHRISWDMVAPVEQQGDIITAQLMGSSILFASGMTTAHPQGQVISYGIGWDYDPAVPFSFGQSYSFEVLMDLDANYYNFWLDGALLSDHVGISADANLEYMLFGQNQYMGLQAGIDNFKWEVNAAIPEPGTASLLLLGLPALGMARHLIPTQKKPASK